MKLELREYKEMRPNGDRDTQRHPCSRWDVVLVDEVGGQEMVAQTFSQYDSWYCHINDREPVEGEALKYTLDLSNMLNLPGTVQVLEEQVVPEVEQWVVQESMPLHRAVAGKHPDGGKR